VREAATPAIREQILNGFAAQVYLPYMVMAAILVALSVWIVKSPLPDINASEANAQSDGGPGNERNSIFQFPHLWLGALCIFVYVGVEVLAGDAIGTYGKGFHIPTDETKYFTSFTLSAMLLGYIIGVFTIPRVISQELGLAISAVLGISFSAAAYLTTGYTSVYCVAALGLANALMWPAIFPLAIRNLGRLTERGSAIVIMGIAGGAILPYLFASLKDRYDFQAVFLCIAVPCYLYVLYYARRGHKAGQARAAARKTVLRQA
jgi:glucose/galactose transporter